jgi:adenylyltransferase/sulfurtransferase
VAIAGLGGLGATLAAHLVRAGVGEIVLIDRDIVEFSNLPRQMLYDEQDATEGLPKAEAAARHLAAVAGETRVEVIAADLTGESAPRLLSGVDMVLDGLDNFETRFVLNDYCRRERIHFVYGGAVGSMGAVLLVPGTGPVCLRCLFHGADDHPDADTCETAGVLSPLPSMIASLQASEALRCFAEDEPAARLWNVDPWHGRAFVVTVKPTERCPCCKDGLYPALERPDDRSSTKLCGRDTVQVWPGKQRSIDLSTLARRWEGLGETRVSRFLARLEVDGCVLSVFQDGRALVQGTDSPDRARSLYARYVGA